MPEVQLNELAWISQAEELEVLASHLSKQSILAVDTESNSLYVYRERVCLVQISTNQEDYLVDPLALDGLAELAPIFSNPHIEKVFHAAEYDLICLRRDFGFQFANLFDTMLAARILGRKAVGLGSILEADFGISMDKRYQRANWGQRPMPANLMDYARMDSHYLIGLRDRLRGELEASGRWPLAQEDFRRLCNASEPTNNNHSEPSCRVSGAAELDPQQYSVLLELCHYRDQVARQMDRPLFKVIGDKTLLAVAEACPKSYDELKKLPEITHLQVDRHGAGLLKAVQRGLKAPPTRIERHQRPDDGVLARIEALKIWRKQAAHKMGVESDVVLPRDLMHALAVENPTGEASLRQVMYTVPWRLEHFGDQILEILKK